LKYRKNYLKVIFQLKFDPILELQNSEPVQFKNKIKEQFPHLKLGRRITIKAEIKGLNGKEEKSKTPMTIEEIQRIWTFSDKDNIVLVSVSANDFTLEYNKYQDISTMDRDFDFLWSQFQTIYNVGILSRVGLRYINQINFSTGDPLDWKGYISSDIIKAVLGITVPDKHRLGRSTNTIFWLGDDHRIKFQFGIHNREFPNPIAKKEFILDYDCFSIDPVDASEARKHLKYYNELIGNAFEQSIDKKLRKEMEPIGTQSILMLKESQ